MEVFYVLFDILKSGYVYYFSTLHYVFSFVVGKDGSDFLTAYIGHLLPIMFISVRLTGMNFIENMRRHYGLHIYALLIAFIWLKFSGNVDIGNVTFDEAAKTYQHTNSAIFVTLVGLFGILSLRGRIYVYERAMDRHQKKR